MPAAWANRCSLKRLHLSNRSTRTLGSGSWIRSKLRAPDPAERPPRKDTRITKPRQSTLIGRQWTPSIRIVDRDIALPRTEAPMSTLVRFLLGLILASALPTPAQATFSIVARDPETGDLGVAVQSHYFSVGPIVPWAEPGVGAVATQSLVEVAYGPRGLALMKA